MHYEEHKDSSVEMRKILVEGEFPKDCICIGMIQIIFASFK